MPRQRQQLEKEDIEFRVSLARRLVKDDSETIEVKRKALHVYRVQGLRGT